MSLGSLFKLTRFPLVFTAVADSAVGAALVGVNLLSCSHVLPAVAASAFLYAGGMVLNDVCDLERDRTLHPERPLPSGRVSRNLARLFTRFLFALAILSAYLAGPFAIAWTLFIVVLIAGYNMLLKRWAIPGSLAMAAIRGSNMALGAVAVGMMPASPEFPWIPIAVLTGYVFFLTLWSTREDRGDGRRGFPAVVGSALVWAPVTAALRSTPYRWAALIPTLWILPWVLRAVAKPEPVRMMQVVRWGVLGIILVDASFLASLGRWTEAGMVAGLILPALAVLPLFRRL